MNGNLSGFNANNVEPPKDFGLLPAGQYTACITASEMKGTQKGDGSYLSLEFTIIDDGEYANRKLWENLNLDNPNQQTVQIAESHLGAICKACAESTGNQALETPQDSSDLHDIPIMLTVAIKKEYNVIRKWEGIQGAGKVQRQPAQNTAGAPQGGQQQFGGQGYQAPQGGGAFDPNVPPQGQPAQGQPVQQGGQQGAGGQGGAPWGQNRG